MFLFLLLPTHLAVINFQLFLRMFARKKLIVSLTVSYVYIRLHVKIFSIIVVQWNWTLLCCHHSHNSHIIHTSNIFYSYTRNRTRNQQSWSRNSTLQIDDWTRSSICNTKRDHFFFNNKIDRQYDLFRDVVDMAYWNSKVRIETAWFC